MHPQEEGGFHPPYKAQPHHEIGDAFKQPHKDQSALSGALIVSGSQAAKAFAILPRLRASSLDSLFLKHHPGINSYSAISMSKHRVEVELFYVGVLLHKVGDF